MLQNKGVVKINKCYQEDWKMLTDEVRWEVIEELVKFQEKFELKIAPKLSAQVLKRGGSHFGKMDVGCAMSVFSKDTAAAIEYIVLHHNYPQEYLTTAQVIYQVAHWFDIMRCLYFKMAFSLKKPDEYKKQCQFLVNFADFFCSIKINENSDALTDVQKGVLMTTQSVLHLQEDLIQKEGVEFFMAGRTSGDPVESHHGQERGMIKNPTLQIFGM